MEHRNRVVCCVELLMTALIAQCSTGKLPVAWQFNSSPNDIYSQKTNPQTQKEKQKGTQKLYTLPDTFDW